MNGPVVRMQGVGKHYRMGAGTLTVLRQVDLELGRGEYVAIMGPSGSGKSTLLNLLGLLDRPSEGRYFFAGRDVAGLDDDERSRIRGAQVGFVFQSYNLIAQLNVVENIEVPMTYQGYGPDHSRRRAEELARLVGLGERLAHRPAELSGGQQQRVAVARALANDPVLILADEPTGNLDSVSGRDILALLERLHGRGKTLVVVTHDEQVAARAERVIHLLDGRIDRQAVNVSCREGRS